ncbi:MAG: hypothetical protein [Microviridae sp.]|nr:MAG: hypothetical protein [Microviridae sp.]
MCVVKRLLLLPPSSRMILISLIISNAWMLLIVSTSLVISLLVLKISARKFPTSEKNRFLLLNLNRTHLIRNPLLCNVNGMLTADGWKCNFLALPYTASKRSAVGVLVHKQHTTYVKKRQT